MILNENQKEMYKDCMFLNEGLFNRKPKQEPNMTSQEFNEMIKQYKEIYSIIMRNIKNNKRFNEYFSGIYEENMKKINQFIKQLDNIIKPEFENGKLIKISDYPYTFSGELYLCGNGEFYDFFSERNFYPEFEKLFPSGFEYINEFENANGLKSWEFIYKKYPNLKIKFYEYGNEFIVKPTMSYFLKKNNINESSNLNEAIDLKDILKLSGEKFTKAMIYIAKFAKNATTKDKFRRAKLTSNLSEIKELLEPDCVQAFILAGSTACNRLLLPFVAEFFDNKAVTAKEKEAKVKQFRNDLKEAERIAEEEFDTSLKKINENGVKCFKENINECIKPYKL